MRLENNGSAFLSLLSLGDFGRRGFWTLAPKDLLHEILELIVGDAARRSAIDLVKHALKFFVSEMLTLPAETLFQVLLGDITRVVDVEVVECKQHVSFSDGLPTVDCHCQELCVVNLSVVVKVNALKYLINLFFCHV